MILCVRACMCAKSLQLHLTLFDPMDCSPSGSSVHEILQARILGWVAMSLSRGSSWSRDRNHVLMSPAVAVGFFTSSADGETLESQAMF